MRVRPGRKRAQAASNRLARVTAGRDKDTMCKLADALAEQEFKLKDMLVEARKAADLEQVDIAEMIGVDKSTISRFERLDSNPTLSMIRNYAYAVGCLVKHDVVSFPETPEERIDHLGELLRAALANHATLTSHVFEDVARHAPIQFAVAGLTIRNVPEPMPIRALYADFGASSVFNVFHTTGVEV